VRALRGRLGLTQVALAERLGITQAQLSRIEAGVRKPGGALGKMLAGMVADLEERGKT
jgi:transcriptional regulator with XRE-family HTH domain